MRLELTGRHVDITPLLRRLVDRKLARLARLLNDSALSAQVVLTREKRGHRADVTLHARGEKFLHGVGDSSAWETSMSLAIDKIVQQVQRVKGKWKERGRRGTRRSWARAGQPGEAAAVRAPAATGPGPLRARMPRILRAARQAVLPMSVADAVRRAEADGEGVVVFRDVETSALAVLYRRANGDMTLVETE
jgi:ribosomal subunit interface protein